MNLPLIQGYATFKNLNQNLSHSSLAMLIPSSFQQLMSNCLKDPLILHKFLPSAKETSLSNRGKEGSVHCLPAHPFLPVPAFPIACGVLVTHCYPAPIPERNAHRPLLSSLPAASTSAYTRSFLPSSPSATDHLVLCLLDL